MDERERRDDVDDPTFKALLAELDFRDDGPPRDLRDRTLGAVRAAAEVTPEQRRAAKRGGFGRPAVAIGGTIAIAASVLAALVIVLSGAGADRTVTLAGVDGRVIVEVRGREAKLRGGGPQLRAGERYELWTITGTTANPKLTSAGTYRPGANGQVRATLTLPASTPQDAALAVTRERDSDPRPSLPPVLTET